MPFNIEMTLRGVLLAGKWRTEEELNKILTENKRNTLIVELSKHTNQPAEYFQRFDDDALVGKAATAVFLKEAGIRDDSALKAMSDDDQRNTLITENNTHTDRPIKELQGMKNQELVQVGLGWFAKSKTIAGILEFEWDIDYAKVVKTVPEIITSEIYRNPSKDHLAKYTFTIDKTYTNTSTFSEEHGFEISLGTATTFTAGIPKLAENETTVSIDASTTHNWQLGKENSTTQSYTRVSDVEVKPGGKIKRSGSITMGNLDVPYTAKIRTGDGSIKTIRGIWKGVSTVNLVENQEDIED